MTHNTTHRDNNNWQTRYATIITAGTAASTRRAYKRDLTYFWAWAMHTLQQPEVYPVSEECVIRFVLDHFGNMTTESKTVL